MLRSDRTKLKIKEAMEQRRLAATEEEIAECSGIHKSTVKRHLPGLVAFGVIARQPDQRGERPVFSYKIAQRIQESQAG